VGSVDLRLLLLKEIAAPEEFRHTGFVWGFGISFLCGFLFGLVVSLGILLPRYIFLSFLGFFYSSPGDERCEGIAGLRMGCGGLD